MTPNIIRVHVGSGTRILVAVRDDADDAAELVDLLNTHAVGYQFRVEEP
jgi:hypothetical protein